MTKTSHHVRTLPLLCALATTGLGLGAGVGGCARTVPAPISPTDDKNFQASTVPDQPGMDADPPVQDVLLPGDSLAINVIGAQGTQDYKVNIEPDGIIRLPLVGPVKVGGLTIPQAIESVEAAERRLWRFARVSIETVGAGGHQATVLGAVGHPGIYPMKLGQRVSDLLASAGGPLFTVATGGELMPHGDVAAGRLMRGGEVLPISIAKAVSGDPRHNVQVHAGDTLFIPLLKDWKISVLGEVNTQSVFPFRENMRLTEALAHAGGPNRFADNGDVRIVRGPLSKPLVYEANVRDLFNGRGHDVELVPGDVIFVTEHWMASIGEILQRLSPLITASYVAQTALFRIIP